MRLSWPWSGLQSQDWASTFPHQRSPRQRSCCPRSLSVGGSDSYAVFAREGCFHSPSDSRNSALVLGTRAPDWWRIASEAALAKRSETFASHVKLALGTAIVRCQRAIVLADGR